MAVWWYGSYDQNVLVFGPNIFHAMILAVRFTVGGKLHETLSTLDRSKIGPPASCCSVDGGQRTVGYFPSWIPPCKRKGASLHPHVGRRVLAVVERSFFIRLRLLAPWRHVTRPTVDKNAAGSVCGIQRASRPFTTIFSVSIDCKSSKSEVGFSGIWVQSGSLKLSPSVF